MKTKLKTLPLSLVVILASIFTSCSKPPNNLMLIPEDTYALSVIDVEALFKKGKLSELSDLKLFRKVNKEIKRENKRAYRLVNKLIDDPTLSGINFSSDVFVYYVNEAKDERFVCISAELNNEEKFVAFLDDVLDLTEMDSDIEEEDSYKYTAVGSHMAVGWDQDKVLFIAAENYRSRENLDIELEALFELEEKEVITESEKFNTFYENKGDVSIWLSSDLLERSRDFREMEKELDLDLTDNYVSAFLNFKEKNVSLEARVSPNGDLEKMMNEHDIFDNSFSSDLLRYFPEQSFAAASVSLNPKAFYTILEQIEEFEEIESDFEEEMGVDLESMFDALGGNALYSIIGFENMEMTYLDYGYGFDESSAVLLDKRYPISEAGYLSEEDMALLNQGKTIQCSKFNGKYCINILNVLEANGTLEFAIENDVDINWYEGGWEYGRNIEVTREEFVPLMGFAFDLDGDEVTKLLLEEIPEDEIQKHDDYYEFLFDNRYPAYFAFNEDYCFFTNDLKSIKAFADGGYGSGSLKSTDLGSAISSTNMYSFVSLDYDGYPKSIKKEIRRSQDRQEAEMYEVWNDLAESMELVHTKRNSIKLILNTKGEGNSLSSIISILDKEFSSLLD